jgi:hypothetical protein
VSDAQRLALQTFRGSRHVAEWCHADASLDWGTNVVRERSVASPIWDTEART